MKRFVERYPIFTGMIVGCILVLVLALVASCTPVKGGKYVGQETNLYSLQDSTNGVVCYKVLNIDAISCVKVR